MTGRLLTVREAADMLGRSTGFIRTLIADELVAGQKVRGRWYVNEHSLRAWTGSGAPEPVTDFVVMPEIVMPKRYRDSGGRRGRP